MEKKEENEVKGLLLAFSDNADFSVALLSADDIVEEQVVFAISRSPVGGYHVIRDILLVNVKVKPPVSVCVLCIKGNSQNT
ncbi:hypothetical protein NQ317_007723 [Molorchus minor]|uniref:Uncharacterized protein n=1 Tax=Molorchus minor TaxID=1323400 RepID=A0ABQ9JUJ2_9CUCU|nr:hypothetical protein NQ317_007723 [Molorchus minor]